MAQTKSVRKGWVTKELEIEGKTVLITGANTGIGFSTALNLAKRKAKVIIACRSLEKAESARQKIIEETGSHNVFIKHLNLASFDSIRKFSADINATEERLDILINNAGLLLSTYEETEDGFEMHFGVNHLGSFLLTNLLLELLKKSSPSRIVNVSSIGHKYATIDWEDPNGKNNFSPEAYGRSKLMNILFSRELSKRLDGTGVTSNSLHPGAVKTEIARDLSWSKVSGCLGCLTVCAFKTFSGLMISPDKGAQTSIYCAIAPELEGVTGKYFSGCKVVRESSDARDDESASKLWKISEELTGLHETENSGKTEREDTK
uniref:retinol dehydrogenase 12-like n=1 Tax=Styela clava TaxID=7725 RepID=UPI0019397D8F|nr:retinol dehydrogenase 12-like [Styela clava]